MEVFVVVICLINAFSAVSSVISNALVFLAILKTPSLHTPSNILLCNLALSDFGVSLIFQPLLIINVITFSGSVLEYKTKQMENLLRASGLLFCALSASTMVAISLDRFLALYLHIRYYTLVTVKRTRIFLLILWTSYSIGLPTWAFSNRNFSSAVVLPFTSLYFMTSLFCYIKIFQIVRRHRRQIAVQFKSVNVPFPKQGKSITTTLYIHGLFIICLIPILISNGVSVVIGKTQLVQYLLYVSWTILGLNSSLNPYLYCYRMRDIKKVVVNMAKFFLCWRFLKSKRES